MCAKEQQVEEILQRTEEALQCAELGLADVIARDPERFRIGLKNVITFGRSITFVLQNLRTPLKPGEFDEWYAPHQAVMKNSPLMRHFTNLRNEIEKQGKLNIGLAIKNLSISSTDMAKFEPRPPGASSFFIGDQIGGSGWIVEHPNGSSDKYYVSLPKSMGSVEVMFADNRASSAPELKDVSAQELCQRYIRAMRTVVELARERFAPKPATVPPPARARP